MSIHNECFHGEVKKDVSTFWVNRLQSHHSIQKPKFPYGSCPRDYHWPVKSNHALEEIQVAVIYSLAIHVSVTSECSVKRVIC